MTERNFASRNRKNARKSTGPKTPEGKKAVSQNAVRHGATSRPDPSQVSTWLRIISDDPHMSFDGLERGGDDDRRGSLQLPQHLACQVVAADLSAARNHQFGALGGFPKVGSAEVAGFIARDLPQDLACLGVKGAQGRSLFVVVHHIHPPLVQDRGSGGAPSVAHLVGLQGLRPNHFALEIEAEQPHRSKQHVHVLAVGDRCLGGVAILDRKSTRLNSSHSGESRMPSSA